MLTFTSDNFTSRMMVCCSACCSSVSKVSSFTQPSSLSANSSPSSAMFLFGPRPSQSNHWSAISFSAVSASFLFISNWLIRNLATRLIMCKKQCVWLAVLLNEGTRYLSLSTIASLFDVLSHVTASIWWHTQCVASDITWSVPSLSAETFWACLQMSLPIQAWYGSTQ